MALRNFFSSPLRRHHRGPSTRPRSPRQRLSLLSLEDRTVPNSYIASSASDLIADINAANLSPGADTITLSSAKSFTLTAVNNTAHGPTGLPVIADGEVLTIVGSGHTIERATKSADAFRLIEVAPGATLTLQNLTLQGGLSFEYYTSAQGGAIFNQGDLTLNGVTAQGNTARGGQGFNTAAFVPPMPGFAGEGGGVYSEGALTIESSVIQNNLAVGGPGADTAFLSIAGYTYPVGPTAGGMGLGGGLFVASGSVAISNSTVSSNSSQGGKGGKGAAGSNFDIGGYPSIAGGDGGDALGGGVYIAGGSASLLITSITHNTAQGGTAGKGGGSAHNGNPGHAWGGGLFIDPSAAVSLDDYTAAHTKANKASTSNNNIFGNYDVIP